MIRFGAWNLISPVRRIEEIEISLFIFGFFAFLNLALSGVLCYYSFSAQRRTYTKEIAYPQYLTTVGTMLFALVGISIIFEYFWVGPPFSMSLQLTMALLGEVFVALGAVLSWKVLKKATKKSSAVSIIRLFPHILPLSIGTLILLLVTFPLWILATV